MKRTTIMAPADLLDRLQTIARQEQIALAEVIRQGLEWRAGQGARAPRFIGAGRSLELPNDAGRRAGEMEYQPRSWR